VVELSEIIPKFYGRYKQTLDDKGRAAIPAKIREIVELLQIRTLVLRLIEKSNAILIRAYPVSYFREKILPMASHLDEETEIGIFKMQSILALCHQVKLDNQGRINIPTEFLQAAKIEKEIRYVGMGDFFDIWDAASYEQFCETGKTEKLQA
jgi:MraZ protein